MVIGIVAVVAFSITVTNVDQNVGKDAKTKNSKTNTTTSTMHVVPELMLDVEASGASTSAPVVVGFQTFLTQLSQHRNFKLFCVLNLLQVFDCTFEKNFLGSFLRQFTDLSPQYQSVVVSLSFVLPWGCTVFLTPIVKRVGLHQTLQNLFSFRIFCSIMGVAVGVVLGRTHWFFLLLNRVSSECVCRLIPLIIAQLSDEDIYLHQRDRSSGSLRASVFGAANVVGKIGQSAAPMFGYFLLMHEQREVDVGGGVGGGVGEEGGVGLRSPTSIQHSGMLIPVLVAAVPLCVVVSQLSLWNRVNLHGAYLKTVSAYVNDENCKFKHTA